MVAVNLADADIWDDTLLIKRYDESLMLAKEEVARRIAQSTNTDDVADSEAGCSSQNNVSSWDVGDKVRCTFSEDGIDYEAEILSIKDGFCNVKYLGYNNEELIKSTSLIPSWGSKVREQQIQAAALAVAESLTNVGNETSKTTTTAQKSKRSKQLKTFERFGATMFPPPPPMPPMPPMPEGVDCDDADSEGMASMLMAWYMCGYYTGLHQGRKIAQ